MRGDGTAMSNIELHAEERQKERQIFGAILSLTVLTVFQLLFYWKCFDPDLVFGDLGDGRFNNCLCEFWYQFFTRQTGFNDLHSFFPVTDTLAWSDLMLGFGIPYTALRVLGMDMFTAYKAVMTFFVLAGGYTSWLFLRTVRVSPMGSLLGASIAFCSCSFPMIFAHTQMFFVSFVPVTSIFVIRFFQAIWEEEKETETRVRAGRSVFRARRSQAKRRRGKRILYGCASILGFGLEFWTAFYVAYFHVFSVLTILLIALVFLILSKINLKKVWNWIKGSIPELLVYMTAALFWLIPFLSLYLPVLKEFGGRETDTVLLYSPRLFDIAMKKSVWIHNFDQNPEEIYAFSILACALLVIVTIYDVVRVTRCIMENNANSEKNARHEGHVKEGGNGKDAENSANRENSEISVNKGNGEGSKKTPMKLILGMSLTLSSWLIYLSIVRFGDFSVWSHVISRILPGASAIRSISRLISFLILPAGISIALSFDDLYQLVKEKAARKDPNIRKIPQIREGLKSQEYYSERRTHALFNSAALILIVLIMLESSFEPYMRWTISSQKEMLDTVKPVPEDCRAFFVCADQGCEYKGYIAMEDAWIIALDSQIYTLNGNSGHSPKGWGLSDPNGENYRDLVLSWVNQYGIQDQTYALIMPSGRWMRYTDWESENEEL